MIYFISDIHLGATYIADRYAHEKRVTDFLDSIAADATELYLLGDILDYWYEYRTVVPRGYVRFLGALARLVDRGVKVTWLSGNHDIWLFDYLRDEIGIEIIDAPRVVREIGGKRFVLTHGDRVGDRSLSFRFICSLFRNKVCQKLYSSIHPRWTVPLAHVWSKSSRGTDPVKEEAEHRKLMIKNLSVLADAEPRPDYIITGHYHIAVEEKLHNGVMLIGLGDWIDKDTYAVFDGKSVELRTFTATGAL